MIFCVMIKENGGELYMRGPKLKNRLGETNTMKNGLSASIVRYKSSAEIDVQFEDGIIVKHRSYFRFQVGSIGYPKTT